jgi:predicted metal-dependent peptidase
VKALTAAKLYPVTEELIGWDKSDAPTWLECCKRLAKLSTLPNEGDSFDFEHVTDMTDATLVDCVERMADDLHSYGSVPDGMEEFVERSRAKARMPWHLLLRRLEAKHCGTDRQPSFARLSRRFPSLPGRHNCGRPLVFVAVDSSASMSARELALIDPELRGMALRGAEIELVQIDTAIHQRAKYEPHAGLTKFVGRGGTDFSSFFMLLGGLPRAECPNFAVYFTDGAGTLDAYMKSKLPKPEDGSTKLPCGCDLLWLLTPDSNYTEASFRHVAPFGQVVKLPTVEDFDG